MTPKQKALVSLAQGLMRLPANLTATAENDRVLLITSRKDDYPRLIGSKGRHVQALECIASVLGVRLIVLEPPETTTPQQNVTQPKPKFAEAALRELVAAMEIAPEMRFDYTGTTHLEITMIAPEINERVRDAIDALLHSIGRTQSCMVDLVWQD